MKSRTICPNCNIQLLSLYSQQKQGGKWKFLNPQLKYCLKCDKVFKQFYFEEPIE